MRHRIAAVLVSVAGVLTALGASPAPAAAPAPLFVTSERCLACHNGLVTPSGEDVSIGFAWRASIMANAARDPYWQAAVRREIMDHPCASGTIQDECAACHMPMARFQAHAAGGELEIFSRLGGGPHERRADPLAIDGVSCALCHQLQNGGPGLEHDGQFRIDTAPPGGQRAIYGPYDVSASHAHIMQSATGFQPTRATNLESSALCSTCHTLFTTPIVNGQPRGQLPEQVPYLEWAASAYASEKTCQACHMTYATEPVRATSILGDPHDRFARHGFQGANFFMLGMLQRFAGELEVAALPQELSQSRQRTLDLLHTKAAQVTIARADVRQGRLEAEIVVTNLSGHKLPTAYPSRRAWLRFRVTDVAGRAIFSSGALRADGSIEGNDNDRDATAFEPHHRVIDSAQQVQVYESILWNVDGHVTTGLLDAVRYGKDNRLLPRGFDKTSAPADCAVHGEALDDPDFQGGSDAVLYRVPLPAAGAGPYQVDVELDYQPIGFRWAHNLEPYVASSEPARFVRYYEAMSDGSATTLAAAHARVPQD